MGKSPEIHAAINKVSAHGMNIEHITMNRLKIKQLFNYSTLTAVMVTPVSNML